MKPQIGKLVMLSPILLLILQGCMYPMGGQGHCFVTGHTKYCQSEEPAQSSHDHADRNKVSGKD